jgi:tripartite-type tricarboxylate transporter receptor subunit TctC
MRRRALLAGLAAAPAARAQGWAPEKPIRLLVPFAAAGSTDINTRILAQGLGERLGQPFVVENRPGAGGNIAAEACVRAAPDGHTLMMATSGILCANKALYRSLPFDPERDFAAIGNVVFTPNMIVVNPALPVTDIAGLIAYAKVRPGELFYGSAGSGTSLHLAGALFCARAGIEMVHVPYKGGAPAAADLLAGKIHMIASPLPEVMGFLRAGQLRPLGATTVRRASALPAIPTIGETLPGFAVTLWNGLVAPAATPPAAVARLGEAVVATLNEPTTRSRLIEQGNEPAPMPPAEFGTFIRADIPRWTEIVRISGASPD